MIKAKSPVSAVSPHCNVSSHVAVSHLDVFSDVRLFERDEYESFPIF